MIEVHDTPLLETEPSKQKKRPPLFSFMSQSQQPKKKKTSISPPAQFTMYLEQIADEPVAGLEFWSMMHNQSKYPSLFKLAGKVLSVPASSAPVERVFSHGGIFTRPHRATLSDAMLGKLLLLKCNISEL